jgi:hypothetical protein
MEDSSPLLVPAVLVLVSLVVFIAMLGLRKKRHVSREVKSLVANNFDVVQTAGTKFVEENGEVVRRSTRWDVDLSEPRMLPVGKEGTMCQLTLSVFFGLRGNAGQGCARRQRASRPKRRPVRLRQQRLLPRSQRQRLK